MTKNFFLDSEAENVSEVCRIDLMIYFQGLSDKVDGDNYFFTRNASGELIQQSGIIKTSNVIRGIRC